MYFVIVGSLLLVLVWWLDMWFGLLVGLVCLRWCGCLIVCSLWAFCLFRLLICCFGWLSMVCFRFLCLRCGLLYC